MVHETKMDNIEKNIEKLWKKKYRDHLSIQPGNLSRVLANKVSGYLYQLHAIVRIIYLNLETH